MTNLRRILTTLAVSLAVVSSGCFPESEQRRERRGERGEHGEHDRDGHGHHGKEGEESGKKLGLNETYDHVRHGARLILAYYATSNSFKGSVTNTTKKTLKRVRVEVHLFPGKELGPTKPGDLKPGEKRDIVLVAKSTGFTKWNAHPEVGSGEHGHGEHGRDGKEHR